MEATTGRRSPFQVLATTTPKLVVGAGSRQAVVFVNNTSGDVYLGASGTLTSLGFILGTGLVFHDLFSSDEWWVQASSSSGTISGYTVI
jgi:hypothetical protein